ncbi:hypothetical protein GOBAR_AA21211 [Gossypium barbadense]|uniref:Septum-promoting GTP-binding protein 1 n=1 Tax=Gossypium barbadense TaxID=3634 RepID=A0A2P5X806_GOSBA|nr:hypothetical protein GOBAR_AA21211 [Gossypium barbadense]
MTLPSMKTVHLNTKWGPIQYRRLTRPDSSSSSSSPVEVVVVDDNKNLPEDHPPMICNGNEADSDLVSLKISLLGDCQIGKTSFLVKYVGDEQEKSLRMTGLNLVNKTLFVQGARIAFSIWDVGGDSNSLDLLPIACKNAVAILFMFDLTSRCTLNGVVGWYSQARKWNQTAIPILVGTKFDDFVGLPPDLQWTIVTQARAYARAMNATLFFSSATHNINVNKIFKFIMAKLFNLPWTVERNLTIGEPIIDF